MSFYNVKIKFQHLNSIKNFDENLVCKPVMTTMWSPSTVS